MQPLFSRTARTAAALSAALLVAAPALADPVTSAPVSGVSVIDFSAYDAVTTTTPFSAAVDVGTASGLESVLLDFSDYGTNHILGAVPTTLGVNSSWPVNGAFVGLNQASGYMTFSFGRGLAFVGGLISFDPASYDGDMTLTALDEFGNALEDVSFGSGSNFGAGEFHGFSRSAGDIWGLQLSNANVVLDNLTFSAATGGNAVPEPASLGLVVLAGLLLAGARRHAG